MIVLMNENFSPVILKWTRANKKLIFYYEENTVDMELRNKGGICNGIKRGKILLSILTIWKINCERVRMMSILF